MAKNRKHDGATATLEPPANETGWLPGTIASRSIREIVDEFLAVMQAHPDAKLLSIREGGRPDRHDAFPGTLTESQNVISVRFLIRT